MVSPQPCDYLAVMKAGAALILLFCLQFQSFCQNRYDVVIDEIMADPSPQIGLPNNEWIELRNTTNVSINLQGWRIGKGTAQSGPMTSFTLQPDSFVIVCSNSAVTAMSAFGPAISVTSFPSLDNDGDLIFLRSPTGTTIHSVAYSISWYQNELKKDGGWTLEMIDSKSPCAGISNWKASTHPQGGTPAKINSVDAINNDQTPPRLKYAFLEDSMTIIAVFDEPVDSLQGATPANYSIDNGLSITSASTLAPAFFSVQLKTNDPLITNKLYTLIAHNIADCRNNIMTTSNSAKIGIPVEAQPLDIVINEILSNPRTNGSDYVELFNASQKIFDISRLYLANRNDAGSISSAKQICLTHSYFFPGDYLVATESGASLALNYLVKNPEAVIELPSLPSYPDDEGDVIVLNSQGELIDEVQYKDDWQFKLIANAEGVSLERIDPAGPSTAPANWHSAASTAGYGTPGYKNSQYKQTQTINAMIDVSPRTFSPDNDGRDDIVSIQYSVDEPGNVANITIFNMQGLPIRYLVKNAILGLTGQWTWDGVDEKGNQLPIGPYIVYSEIFNLKGKKQQFKNTIVLARRLN